MCSSYVTALVESLQCLYLCLTHDSPHHHHLGENVKSPRSFLICCLHTFLALSLATFSLETTHTPGISSYCLIFRHSPGGFLMPLFICTNFLPCLETQLSGHLLGEDFPDQIPTCTLHGAVLVLLPSDVSKNAP